MKGYKRQSRESTIVKKFLKEHLNEGTTKSTCEKIYQLSQRVAKARMSKRLLSEIIKVSKVFVDDYAEKTRGMSSKDTGRCLYSFDCLWSRSMNLFGKVFCPIIRTRRKFIDRLSSKLFMQFVKNIEDKIVKFIIDNIREEIQKVETNRRTSKPESSSLESSSNKKQKLSQDEPGKLGELKERDFGVFESLSRKEKISTLIGILQGRGCFDLFLERVVGSLTSVLDEKIDREGLGILAIKRLIDEQRKAGYMKDYFYAVESNLMRKIVIKYTNEEIFKMLDKEDEMRLCMGFFCASNEEKRLMEALDVYFRKIMGNPSIDDFIGKYYWIYLKFRELENSKDGGYERIIEGIRNCKKDILKLDAECVVECVCRWTDSFLRGKIIIQENTIEGMESPIFIPGSERKEVINVERVLKKIGIDSLLEGNGWREYLVLNIFDMIGEMFRFCDYKEMFETTLQGRLGSRLVSGSSISMDWEIRLIDKIDSGRSTIDKMRCMIKDFMETEQFMGHDILLLRGCKWPRYEETILRIPDVEEVKKRYNHVVKNKRKIIRWNDLLSSCEIEFLGRMVRVTLPQYLMMKLLVEKDRTAEDLKICKSWDKNLEVLVKKGLVKVEGKRHFLNMDYWKGDFPMDSMIPDMFPLLGPQKIIKMFDESESYKDLLDCKIIKEMKANKTLSKSGLKELLNKTYPQEILDERIDSLANREFLSVEGENIKYVP
ncbi:uncharacterized protein Eint_091850 [Encephalitozoon intestinalis ATCC 50506]|uniref:Cullin family profile domain-containing protein n=1 Tax=Encephalitozoon intestinalis (strain ATCC 50506) TaxID=876142 RepID=E0S969_ENCIT|nr:uncharacterized protein Eint_091850 [Encephalitozoon intestinalis ATCC 50506]ADM12312.1 hypothetical protein Eint_091850 [Encephalitozoon intestinalis ATCC 50506]UTX46124.1 hypothetical protein GPK93_09g17130 [Encephalitozoon intestinalis]